jgi:hypothetical protein
MKDVYLFFILLIFCTVSAQQTTSLKTIEVGIVKGKILDKKSASPIEFATITLMNQADSSIINGTVSSKTGDFEIKGIAYGNYLIKTKYIGDVVNYNDVVISKSSREVSVGIIHLSFDSKNLLFNFVL